MNTQGTTTFSKAGIAFEVVEQGTIRIGGTRVYQPGEPVSMSDGFDITTLEQAGGEWKRHPVEAALPSNGGAPRRVIPITIPYDDPDLVVQSRLTAYDQGSKRVACRGTTEGCARRRVGDQIIDVACSGPDTCSFAAGAGIECKWFGRMRFHIDVDSEADDPTQVFVLRSAGYNTLRGIEAAIRQYHALFGGRLRGIKFRLVMRTGTSASSEWNPYEFIEMSLNGMTVLQAAAAAKSKAEREAAQGLDYPALEAAVRAGVENSEFSKSSVEGALAAEFFPVESSSAGEIEAAPHSGGPAAWSLSSFDLNLPSRRTLTM